MVCVLLSGSQRNAVNSLYIQFFFSFLHLSVFLLYSDAVFLDAQNPKQLKYCWLSYVILRQYSFIHKNTCLLNSCGQFSYLIEQTFEIYFYSFSFNIFWSYPFFLSPSLSDPPSPPTNFCFYLVHALQFFGKEKREKQRYKDRETERSVFTYAVKFFPYFDFSTLWICILSVFPIYNVQLLYFKTYNMIIFFFVVKYLNHWHIKMYLLTHLRYKVLYHIHRYSTCFMAFFS